MHSDAEIRATGVRAARIAALPCAFAVAIAASGCATTIKGTTQRVAVLSDPIGAACTLKNVRMEAPAIVSSTPGEALLRRDGTHVEVNCSKEGFLEFAERHQPLTGRRVTESHRRQVIVADALLRHLELNDGTQDSVVNAAERQRELLGRTGATLGIASVALPVTVGATLVPTLGGGAAVAGAGVIAGALMLGLVVAVPISLAVDFSTGAFNDYPTVMTVIMTPAGFPDPASRDAWFAAFDRRLDAAERAIRDDTKADCFLNCGRRGEDDDTFIAEWRARVADARSRTAVAADTIKDASLEMPADRGVK